MKNFALILFVWACILVASADAQQPMQQVTYARQIQLIPGTNACHRSTRTPRRTQQTRPGFPGRTQVVPSFLRADLAQQRSQQSGASVNLGVGLNVGLGPFTLGINFGR
jgi:hypothetical protein